MDYENFSNEELDVEENGRVVQCYCEDHCPFGDTKGICEITSPGGKCYASVVVEVDEYGDEYPKMSFGCQPDAQMAVLQCKGPLIPHLDSEIIECCNDANFCNKYLFY